MEKIYRGIADALRAVEATQKEEEFHDRKAPRETAKRVLARAWDEAIDWSHVYIKEKSCQTK